ncbi:BTAD domain-containing putative transcriptional regulator [Micromonospora sp. DT233]|uniref:BTAD domain-containing putative transcriptional regulator n=1 Tax=Micromonospora sp. DT233 TaxID=3393432 RepID=UPI003CEF4466
MDGRTTAPAVTFGVLGPVVADTPAGPVALRGPRHRAVLARLLVARGRVVPVDRLVDDLWVTPPHAPVAAIRTFVADLRRALEPDRPPREAARLLVTAAPGYALQPAPGAVDAWRFEAAVDQAGRLLAAGRAEAALTGVDDALGLWRGPAYAEHAADGWARAEIDRLDELRLLAAQRRAEALLALGRAAEAAAELRAHAEAHPLREETWRLLALALYRAGRQGDALAALRRARRTLAAELGVDPGVGLRQLEADVLAQAPHLDLPAVVVVPVAAPPLVVPVGGPPPPQPPLVGRDEEQGRLLALAGSVARRGRPALALVGGEAGAGKTALVEALTGRLHGDGWTAAWGRSPEYDGAPVAWPWTQITDALAAGRPGDPTGADPSDAAAAAPEPAVARFRLHRAVAARVTAAARRGPVLLVLDDLHRADGDTLDLLTALLTPAQPVTGPVLVVGTFRPAEVNAELTGALARCARLEPLRIGLGGLSEPATGDLARAVTGRDLDAATARLIHLRADGNPFFVRELARLLAEEGDAASSSVPTGVRDVIRHRLAQLPDPTRTVLRQAAVLGRDIDPDVLAALGGDESATLDALDRAAQAGFLTGGDPHRLRFTHILVRDTLYDDLPALRRGRWHAAVGDAMQRLRPHDVVALAHHFALATGPGVAARAARYAHAAAQQAERRCHPHDAARLWGQAVAAHDRAGHGDTRDRLAALLGLGRTLAVTGHLQRARRYRAEALDAERRVDDPDLTVAVLTEFVVPAVWTRNDDEALSHRIVQAVDRALAGVGRDGAQRSRLLSTLALELRGTTTDRGRRAAGEAEAIARASGDPALLALALNARFMHAFDRPGRAPLRARIGAELVEVAARHDLVTFEVLGHLILVQAHCALADLRAADAAARAAQRLADRYDLPLVAVFTGWYAALRLAMSGRWVDAEAAYQVAHARLAGSGMSGLEEGLLPLALLSLRLTRQRETGGAGLVDDGWDWGPHEPWVRPLLLLGAGQREAAAGALRDLPDSPHDLLWEARLCLAGRAALALGDQATMRRVHAALLPAAGELAGAGSGLLTLGPVADHLADLEAALARPGDG